MQSILLVLRQKQVNCALPDDVKMIVSYTGKKLGTCFNVKDKTVFNHEHGIVSTLSVQRNLVHMIM